MATPAQILANRENAQLSTGPRSEEGKANSSANALRHGLAARGLIVLPGQEPAFEQLETGLRTSLCPIGTLQETLFTCILESAWNLHRCRLAEAQLYLSATDANIDPLLDFQNEAKYARIHRYARQSQNSMLRVMRELGKIQTEIQYRQEIHALAPKELQSKEAQSLRPTADPTPHRAKALLEKLTAPPPFQSNFQNEANSPEEVIAAPGA